MLVELWKYQVLFQVLQPVKAHKVSSGSTEVHEHDAFFLLVSQVQEYLFPFSARYNSLLATILIQLAPCFIVLSIPGLRKSHSDNKSSVLLPVLVSFAFGTLLGDILLHILPELFESDETNPTVTGSAIFAGFIAFLFLDKAMRVMSSGVGEEISLSSHSHSHTHAHDSQEIATSSSVSVVKDEDGLKQRKNLKSIEKVEEKPLSLQKLDQKSKFAAYLNIVTGCVHNVTDGIALASSFYTSKHMGATTTIAVLFHEIPHEIGDFVILLSSGFTFAQALKSQLITSIGAIVGTAIGCTLNEMRSDSKHSSSTALNWLIQSDLLLPVSTGVFIYIATVGVAPQILQRVSTDKSHEAKIWTLQLGSVIAGFALMMALALLE